ncbi:MAG: porin family protein [Prevotella sp.]|nr:porin family protein [Prevotella sp.]
MKRMKKMMMIVVMMIATMTASAQQEAGSWSLTPKVAMNLANLSGDISGNNMKVALAAGADVMYQINSLVGISGGLMYSMQGCNGDNDVKLNYDFINIPLLANFYVAPNFALKVGLQPAFVASAKWKVNKNETDVKDNLQTLDLSVPIGASYEISDFVIDARYNLGVAKINKGNGSIRNSVFQISVGYKIPF